MGGSKIKSIKRPEKILTGTLDIDKVDIVGRGVDHRPESHGIGDLPVEPDVLIGREKPGHLGADDLDNIAQHRDEDKTAVECEDQTGTPGRPYGELEPVEGSKLRVGLLGEG